MVCRLQHRQVPLSTALSNNMKVAPGPTMNLKSGLSPRSRAEKPNSRVSVHVWIDSVNSPLDVTQPQGLFVSSQLFQVFHTCLTNDGRYCCHVIYLPVLTCVQTLRKLLREKWLVLWEGVHMSRVYIKKGLWYFTLNGFYVWECICQCNILLPVSWEE